MRLPVIIAVICVLSSLVSCLKQETLASKENVNVVYKPETTPTASNDLSIDLEIYGWWWSKDQLRNGFPADNPPPKNEYVKLERWDASEEGAPHPDKIDIVCVGDGLLPRSEGLKAVTTVDFKIASYNKLTQLKSNEDFDEILNSLPWQDERKVGEIKDITTQIAESKDLQFKDFDLHSVLDKYFKAKNDLWPWKMRVVFLILDDHGNELFHRERILDLIPAD